MANITTKKKYNYVTVRCSQKFRSMKAICACYLVKSTRWSQSEISIVNCNIFLNIVLYFPWIRNNKSKIKNTYSHIL